MLADLMAGLRRIDPETRLLLARVVVRASKSGNANEWLKHRLKRILEEEDAGLERS